MLAVSAIIMVPLLAISGMATDIGGWYAEGAKMQKAADAAALAGVVWLPDLSKATAVANETAKQNGFDPALSNIDIVVGQLSNTDLRVSITDTNAPIFFSKFFMSSMTIKRESIATYVLPVPLGSPGNYFGTGPLAPSADGMWASINGWCAPKEQGDPFAVGWEGNWPSSGQVCPGTTANGQYIANPTGQYEYIIKVPTTRVLPIVVHLYSPAKTASSPRQQRRLEHDHDLHDEVARRHTVRRQRQPGHVVHRHRAEQPACVCAERGGQRRHVLPCERVVEFIARFPRPPSAATTC